MKRIVVALVLSVFLSACGASADPALQGRIAGYFGNSSAKSFPATGKFLKPMPYAVGQYVMSGIVNDGKRSISKMSIVGQEQGGWIIETYSLSESDEAWTQMLVKGLEQAGERGSVDDIDIVWVKTKQKDGKVVSIEGPVLSITRGIYRGALGGFKVSIAAPVDGGTVSVPAGIFSGTMKSSSESSFLGRSYKSDGWFHADVPINGMVKSTSVENNMTIELLEFGRSGAVRSF
jgi:hypothetical protein